MQSIIQAKIAIIIPVYNAEKYLSDCLSSIEKQQFKNFTAFIIDDGSSDESAKIAKQWTQKDPRFIYIHKENGGPASARNLALDQIFRSKNNIFKYITFIDSDDTVDERYLHTLITSIENTQSDIAICEYQRFSNDPPNQYSIHNKPTRISKTEFLRAILSVGQWSSIPVQGIVCAKLYKSEIIKNIRFPNTLIEDETFNISTLCNPSLQTICFIPHKLYFYRETPFSQSTRADVLKEQLKGRLFCYNIAKKSQLPQQTLDIILLQAAVSATQCVLHGDNNIVSLIKPYKKSILDANAKTKQLNAKTIFRFKIFCNHPFLTYLYIKKRQFWDKIHCKNKIQ